MAHKVHVLLVEHDSKDHDRIMDILQYHSYQVTSMKLASTALSFLSKGKTQFDVVMVNTNSPDSYGFQLVQDAIKMDLLVILMSNDDDPTTTMRALEQGVFLCINKPVTMHIIRCLWQHVLREKARRLNENEGPRYAIEYNNLYKEFGEVLAEGNRKNNNHEEEEHKSRKGVNSTTSQHDEVMFKKKVWIEWTEELHQKFMDVATQLGEGRCYPKEILELMNVSGLTRMQVASHLQKCRNANWLPPSERNFKLASVERTPLKNKARRAKTERFGSMPCVDNHSQFHLRSQEYNKGMNHQEFTIDRPTRTNMHGNNGDGSLDKGYQSHQLVFDRGSYPFAHDYEMLNINTFEVPNMEPRMVHNFFELQQELVMDHNEIFQSLVNFDEVDRNQVPIVSNVIDQCTSDAQKSMNDEEIEGIFGGWMMDRSYT